MTDVTLRMLLLGEDKTASRAIKGVGTTADQTSGKMKKGFGVAGAALKGALAADVIAEGARAVADFGKDSIDAFRTAEQSQRKLQDAFSRFPKMADTNITKLRALNSALQAKTGADDDQLAASQAVLARYKLTGKQIEDMTPLVVDFAKATGRDLPSASTTLGKALAGNTRAMKELGIPFKDTGNSAKNFDQIMGGLREKVGGFAEKEGATLDGKLEVLQANFGDLQEKIGEKLLPVVVTLADAGLKLVDWISQNVNWLGPLAAGLGVAAAAFAVLNVVMMANPILLIVAAIGALVGGLIWAYQNVDWFREGVDAAFKAIGDIARWLWNNALAPALRLIVQGFAWVVDGLANFLDMLGNIPGFEWAKGAAVSMRVLAQRSREAADSIEDIPDPQVETDNSQQEISNLDRKIKGLKGKIVEAKAKGMDESSPKVQKLRDKIAALKDKKVTVEANVKKTGVTVIKPINMGGAGGGVRISAYAKGGRPRVGELAMFHADELWVPDTAGTVLTKQKTQQLIHSGPQQLGASSAGMGGDTFIFNVDARGAMDGRKLARDAVAGFKQEIRARRGRPFAVKAFSS